MNTKYTYRNNVHALLFEDALSFRKKVHALIFYHKNIFFFNHNYNRVFDLSQPKIN